MARAPVISRRAFVGGAAASLTGCPDTERAPQDRVMPAEDIAIVGAGLAGLSCAYWLTKAGVEATVYEAGSRTGGRIYTLRNDLPEPLFAELGGEFVAPEHASMLTLAEALGILLSRFDVDAGQRVFWVGARRLREDRVLADLEAFMPSVIAELEAAEASEAALTNLDGTPLARWLDRNTGTDDQADLRALLETAFRAEFGIPTDQQSALNLSSLVGADPTLSRFAETLRYRVPDGVDLFPSRLEKELAKPVRRDSGLVALAKNPTGYTLTFEGPTGVGSQVEAERVVLALPFSVLRSVDLRASGLSPEKLDLIQNLAYGSHTKLVAAFGSRTWAKEHELISDLPFQLIWDSSVDQPGLNGLLTMLLTGKTAADSTASADEQLRDNAPDVERALMTTLNYLSGTARRVRWATNPHFFGSIASPTWGQWQKPYGAGTPEGNVHFCGEHTSIDFRGSMEGAAESGALVAAQILADLGVTQPSGLMGLFGLKTGVPQPHLRDQDLSSPTALTRRRRVLEAHSAFVRAQSRPGAF